MSTFHFLGSSFGQSFVWYWIDSWLLQLWYHWPCFGNLAIDNYLIDFVARFSRARDGCGLIWHIEHHHSKNLCKQCFGLLTCQIAMIVMIIVWLLYDDCIDCNDYHVIHEINSARPPINHIPSSTIVVEHLLMNSWNHICVHMCMDSCHSAVKYTKCAAWMLGNSRQSARCICNPPLHDVQTMYYI